METMRRFAQILLEVEARVSGWLAFSSIRAQD